MKLVATEHIELRPSEIHGEVAWIVGTRIRVADVYVWHELWRWSPPAILVQFPHLTPADIHAAMAYYWDHQDEIQGLLRRAAELEEEMRQKYPSKLPEAIRRKNANGDSVSS